jgi:hypothetical protein
VSRVVSFRVEEEEERVVNRLKKALLRKHGKLHGVFAPAMVDAIRHVLPALEDSAHTQILTKKFSIFHVRLAKIYQDLPCNGRLFKRASIERVIEKHVGADSRTLSKYRQSLIAWDLVVPQGAADWNRASCSFKRGPEPEWIAEALENPRAKGDIT